MVRRGRSPIGNPVSRALIPVWMLVDEVRVRLPHDTSLRHMLVGGCGCAWYESTGKQGAGLYPSYLGSCLPLLPRFVFLFFLFTSALALAFGIELGGCGCAWYESTGKQGAGLYPSYLGSCLPLLPRFVFLFFLFTSALALAFGIELSGLLQFENLPDLIFEKIRTNGDIWLDFCFLLFRISSLPVMLGWR